MGRLIKTFIISFILLFASITFAVGPPAYLVCDPQAGVEKYLINILKIDGVDQSGAHQYIVDAEADGSLHYDISGWPVGQLEGEYFAGKEYVLDGVPQGTYKWSTPPVPFVLIVPSSAAQPTGTKVMER